MNATETLGDSPLLARGWTIAQCVTLVMTSLVTWYLASVVRYRRRHRESAERRSLLGVAAVSGAATLCRLAGCQAVIGVEATAPTDARCEFVGDAASLLYLVALAPAYGFFYFRQRALYRRLEHLNGCPTKVGDVSMRFVADDGGLTVNNVSPSVAN